MLNIEEIKHKIIHAQYPPTLIFRERTGKAHNHQIQWDADNYYPNTLEVERATYTLYESSVLYDESWAKYSRDMFLIKI